MESLRKCNICESTKPIESFEKMYSRKGSPCYRRTCMKCNRVERNERTNKNPLSFLRRNFTQLRSARKIKGEKTWDLLWHDVVEKWTSCEGKCEVSGVKMTHLRDGSGKKLYTNVSIDRIDNDIGYNKENIRLVCWAVNSMKHSMSDTELMLWVSRIHETSRS